MGWWWDTYLQHQLDSGNMRGQRLVEMPELEKGASPFHFKMLVVFPLSLLFTVAHVNNMCIT